MARLQLEGITRRFGRTVAVDDVSLGAEEGEVLSLLGPSGCGKSTLLRVVAGLETPDAGRVLLDGEDVTPLAPAERDVAMVFQSYALYPHMTVEGNVSVHLRLKKVSGDEIRRRVEETAELLDVAHLLDRRPRQLSGGQRQRVALARAIIREPRLFLLDEPLSNLDALLREHTRRELKLLFERLGTTVLYVTHDQSEAMTLADRIAVLRDGRLEQVGTPDQVYARPATRFVASFVGSPPMNLLDAEVRDGRLVLAAGEGGAGSPEPASEPVAGSEPMTTPLPEPLRSGLPEGPVILGIRPEDVRMAPPGDGPADAAQTLPARVVLSESLGSHHVLTLEVGGREPARARGHDGGPRLQVVGARGGDGARIPPSTQERVVLHLPPERLHLFDPASGRRLPG